MCVQDTRHQLEKCQSILRSKQDELCQVKTGLCACPAQGCPFMGQRSPLPGSLVRHPTATPVSWVPSSNHCSSLQCCEAAASAASLRTLLQADASTSEAVKAAKAKWEAQRQEDQQELQVRLCPGRSVGVAAKQCASRYAVGIAECIVLFLHSHLWGGSLPVQLRSSLKRCRGGQRKLGG